MSSIRPPMLAGPMERKRKARSTGSSDGLMGGGGGGVGPWNWAVAEIGSNARRKSQAAESRPRTRNLRFIADSSVSGERPDPLFVTHVRRKQVWKSASASDTLRDPGNDGLAVKASVLDEDAAGFLSRHGRSGYEEPRNVGFERLRIVLRRQGYWIDPHARAFEQPGVRVIAAEKEDAVGREILARAVALHRDRSRPDLDDASF